MQERRADVDVAHEPGPVCERVDGGAARDALVPAPALARGDEAGEREPAERDATLPHAAEQLEGRDVAAAAHAAGDGGVPGGRGPVGHFVEQVERGGGGGGTPLAEVEGEEGVAVEGAERERVADGEAVDGAGEEGVVAEAGEAGARELRDGGVRVVGEQGESRWSALLRGGGSGYAAGGGGGGGEEGMRRRPVEATAVDGRRPGAARNEREKLHPASRRRIRGLFGPSNK